MLRKLDGIEKNLKGYTLIELLLVVSLIALLSTIAYPNYVDYIRSNYRSYAENDMLEISYRLEKVKNKQFSYKPALNSNGKLKDNVHLSYSPKEGDVRYVFSFEINDNDYKIIATPTEKQGINTGKLYLQYDGQKFVKKWDSLNNNSYYETW